MNWYISVIKQYATFSGRARRKEYWMFFLFNILIAIGLGIISAILIGMLGLGPELAGTISTLYSLFIIIPSISAAIRRMHDTGRSGWWIIVPVVGFIFLCLEGHSNDNEYGTNPKFI